MASERDEFGRLMERVRAGCPEAARRVFAEYGGHIRRVVRRKLHQRLRAQFDSLDFTQDVWASFFTAPPEQFTFDTPESLVRFLARLAHNKVADQCRKDLRAQKRNAEVCSLDGGDGNEPVDLPRRAATPSQYAIANEHWERLLVGQPERNRLMLEMLREGHTQKEIAERLGMDASVIRRQLRRLTRRLGLP
jgi:RNA polymerase sigma factor (sigma-70 family)